MTSTDEKSLEKIARMSMFGATQDDIGKVFQVSGSRISQIMELPEYKNKEQEIATKVFNEQDVINRGWDGVEATAVKRVLEHLRVNPEPDFALKAAAVANRAVRRGGQHHNNPINPQSTGVRAVLNLNPTFVQKVQNNFQINVDKRDNLIDRKKDSNFLAPNEVQNLLSTDVDGKALKFDSNKPVTNPLTESIENDLQDLQIKTLVD